MITLSNGESVSRAEIPILPITQFRDQIIDSVNQGARIAALFGVPENGRVRLWTVLADSSGMMSLATADVSERYPSLTPDCPQAHWFERALAEETEIVPEGHPWLKPVRFPDGNAGVFEPYRVEGDEIHEVAVGPVHAGVIEPGHFRFQCHGERVLHLEVSLGYQHRGIEAALVGGPTKRSVHYMETLAGDTTVGHSIAYAMNMEALTGISPTSRAETLRAIALELERLANHTGDLGALAGDTGYLPTASFCGRLRGEYLNLTALICGSRFGRGIVRPGGVGFDLAPDRVEKMSEGLKRIFEEVRGAVELLWNSPSVMARFEGTGIISRESCESLGFVGPAARACGLERDVRADYPFGIYCFDQIPIATESTGDVYARAQVRWLEIQRSSSFIMDLLKTLPDDPCCKPVGTPANDALAVSLVEGWRGEICHVALTNEEGRFASYKIFDPSVHNWAAITLALRNGEISDFPLCNKSFNLSYCGHDL